MSGTHGSAWLAAVVAALLAILGTLPGPVGSRPAAAAVTGGGAYGPLHGSWSASASASRPATSVPAGSARPSGYPRSSAPTDDPPPSGDPGSPSTSAPGTPGQPVPPTPRPSASGRGGSPHPGPSGHGTPPPSPSRGTSAPPAGGVPGAQPPAYRPPEQRPIDQPEVPGGLLGHQRSPVPTSAPAVPEPAAPTTGSAPAPVVAYSPNSALTRSISLVWTGLLGLMVAITGLLIVGRRRRQW